MALFKPDALAFHFDANPDEKEVAKAFFEGFDISRGRKVADLSMWVLDPHLHIKERFGMEKEVLVIYSKHNKTDARALKAIQDIFAMSDYALRLERLVVFLVHRGDKRQTEDIVKSQDNWIIVPFTVDELTDPNRGALFIRSRMAKLIGSEDLFGMSSPIKNEAYFFGRDELVKTLVSRSIIRKEHSGLFGLRKAGKTSILYAIARRAPRETAIVEYVDCHNPGVYTIRWWNSLENIVDRLCELASSYSGKDIVRSSAYNKTNAGTKFLADIRNIITRSSRNVLVMFDEVEFITPTLSGALGAHWDEDFVPFWQTIRAASQETLGGLTFIVAGVNPSSVESPHFNGIPNPIFQLAVPHFLEPLSVQSTRSMVRTIGRYAGLEFSEDVYEHLRSSFGGHPYLMRLACSEAWRVSDVSKPDSRAFVNKSVFGACDGAIRQRISQPIKDILLSLVWWYPDEYDVLRIMAGGDANFFQEYMAENTNGAMQFVRYGLVDSSGNFTVHHLKDFLNKHGSEYLSEIGPFHRGEISPELLPAVPDIDKLAKLFEMKVNLEAKMRRLIIMYLGMHFNWDDSKIAVAISGTLKSRSDRKDPSQLFVGRACKDVINDLYTLDFKDVLVGNWQVFGPLFSNDKPRFSMNMDAINKARRIDGHTLPISEEEMEAFENSYHWVLSRVNKVVEIPNF